MNIPASKKPTVRIFRWDATEIYKNSILVGYIEQQGELYREIMLDTYEVIVWGTESPIERMTRLRNDARFND